MRASVAILACLDAIHGSLASSPCVMPPPGIACWIVGYSPGMRRMQLGEDSRRRRCHLNVDTPWLRRLCGRNNIDLEPPLVCTGIASQGKIYALAELEQGPLHNLLLKHTRESALLWDYYHKPLDAAIVRVSKLWPLVEPIPLHSLQRLSKSARIHGDVTKFTVGSSGVVWGVEGAFTDVTLEIESGRCSFASIYADMSPHLVPIMTLPHIVCKLIAKNLWHDVLWLGRWQRLWPHWPSEEFVAAQRGQHHVDKMPGGPGGTSQRLRSLADDLRTWAPDLIGKHQDDEDKASEVTMGLERHVRVLDALVFEQCSRPGAKQFSAEVLVKSLLYSRQLKDQSSYAETIRGAIKLLPPTLRSLAISCIDDADFPSPSPSTLNRFQLFFDTALMLYRRRAYDNDAKKRVRFLLADSSPQGFYDWLIVKMQIISVEDMRSIRDAVRRLAEAGAQEAVFDDEDEPDLHEDGVDRAELAALIDDAMVEQTLPPVALGVGRAGAESKAAAFVYALFLETGWRYLRACLEEMSSVTKDMGTEMTMNDMEAIDFNKLLPNHVVNARMDADDGEVSDQATQ